MQSVACSNEAASWLKYEDYDGEEWEHEAELFQKMLGCTSTALGALKDHPKAWKPSDKPRGNCCIEERRRIQGLDRSASKAKH